MRKLQSPCEQRHKFSHRSQDFKLCVRHILSVIGHTHLGWDNVTFRACCVRIRNEAKAISVTLLPARLAAFLVFKVKSLTN